MPMVDGECQDVAYGLDVGDWIERGQGEEMNLSIYSVIISASMYKDGTYTYLIGRVNEREKEK